MLEILVRKVTRLIETDSVIQFNMACVELMIYISFGPDDKTWS